MRGSADTHVYCIDKLESLLNRVLWQTPGQGTCCKLCRRPERWREGCGGAVAIYRMGWTILIIMLRNKLLSVLGVPRRIDKLNQLPG